MTPLDTLAARMAEFDRRLQNIMSSQSGMSASGTAAAIALLVTLNGSLFSEAAAALRAHLKDPAHG